MPWIQICLIMRTEALLCNCGTKGILFQYKLTVGVTGGPGARVVPAARGCLLCWWSAAQPHSSA